MNYKEHTDASVELIMSLFKSAPQHLNGSSTRWMWVLGCMASMLVRLSRTDPALRRELKRIHEQGKAQ